MNRVIGAVVLIASMLMVVLLISINWISESVDLGWMFVTILLVAFGAKIAATQVRSESFKNTLQKDIEKEVREEMAHTQTLDFETMQKNW